MVFIIFFLGLVVGSFLNCYIWRLYKGESIIHGRSYCPKCKKTLRWYELIPLVSFALQRGRCRGCMQPIDWQYPIVELVMGMLFVLTYLRMGIPHGILHFTFYILHFYLLSVLTIIFVFDLRYGLVPDVVALPAIVIALLYAVLTHLQLAAIGYLFLAACSGAIFFAAQYYFSHGRWLGAGDIRIGALMGAMVGWPYVFAALVVSYFVGGVVGVILLATGKKKFGQTVPLGTFLTFGTAIVFLYGAPIWNWYFGL